MVPLASKIPKQEGVSLGGKKGKNGTKGGTRKECAHEDEEKKGKSEGGKKKEGNDAQANTSIPCESEGTMGGK